MRRLHGWLLNDKQLWEQEQRLPCGLEEPIGFNGGTCSLLALEGGSGRSQRHLDESAGKREKVLGGGEMCEHHAQIPLWALPHGGPSAGHPRVSNWGRLLSPREHLAMSGDSFACPSRRH